MILTFLLYIWCDSNYLTIQSLTIYGSVSITSLYPVASRALYYSLQGDHVLDSASTRYMRMKLFLITWSNDYNWFPVTSSFHLIPTHCSIFLYVIFSINKVSVHPVAIKVIEVSCSMKGLYDVGTNLFSSCFLSLQLAPCTVPSNVWIQRNDVSRFLQALTLHHNWWQSRLFCRVCFDCFFCVVRRQEPISFPQRVITAETHCS